MEPNKLLCLSTIAAGIVKGLPSDVDDDANRIAEFALEILKALEKKGADGS